MTKFVDHLLTTIADVSSQTGVFSKTADRLLSCLTPQKRATAVGCTAWSYYGCCWSGVAPSVKYRRKCVYGADHFYEYKCSGRCYL